jgi:hypothetical protein
MRWAIYILEGQPKNRSPPAAIPTRNRQFQYLAQLRDRFRRRHLPADCGAAVTGHDGFR